MKRWIALAMSLGLCVLAPTDASAGQDARGCLSIEKGEGLMSFRNRCNVVVHVVYNLEPDRVCRQKTRDYYPCAATISPFARFVIGDDSKRVRWGACGPGYVHQTKQFEAAYSCR